MPASTYRLVEYDAEDERENDPQGPPLANIFAAADYIAAILTKNEITWAAMGGFAMICRGSKRTTRDIDIVTETTMKRLWAIVEPQPRLIIPDTKLIEGVLKVFVRTGPTHDPDCTEDRDIEVDLVMPAAKGSPTQLSLHRNLIQININGRQRSYYALDILYMMKAKLRCITSRCLPRDLEDVPFLLDHFPKEVAAIRDELEASDLEELLDKPSIKAMPESVQKRYRETLFGS